MVIIRQTNYNFTIHKVKLILDLSILILKKMNLTTYLSTCYITVFWNIYLGIFYSNEIFHLSIF